MDTESQQLLSRLKTIEDNLISDELVEQSVSESLKSLQKIYGTKYFMGSLVRKLKSKHNVKRMDHLITKMILKTKTSIQHAKADTEESGLRLSVFKNALLSEHLMNTGKLSKKKLYEIRNFFMQSDPIIEEAFKKGDKEEVKKYLKQYVNILESEKQFLKDNLQDLLFNSKNLSSMINYVAHEIVHIVYADLQDYRGNHAFAVNEAYSFGIQNFMNTFENDFIFSSETLKIEIKKLYNFIPPRKEAYPNYNFIKPFTLIIGVLILCDSIERKNGNFKNQKLFLDSYTQKTFIGKYNLSLKAIDNLQSDELKNIIKETILKTALNHLKKNKEIIVSEIEGFIKKLGSFDKIHTTNNLKKVILDWNNFKESLIHKQNGIFYKNFIQFMSSIGVLIVMGYDEDVKNYKTLYLKKLQKTLNKVIESTKDKNQELFSDENDTLSRVEEIISQEEEDFKDIFNVLK